MRYFCCHRSSHDSGHWSLWSFWSLHSGWFWWLAKALRKFWGASGDFELLRGWPCTCWYIICTSTVAAWWRLYVGHVGFEVQPCVGKLMTKLCRMCGLLSVQIQLWVGIHHSRIFPCSFLSYLSWKPTVIWAGESTYITVKHKLSSPLYSALDIPGSCTAWQVKAVHCVGYRQNKVYRWEVFILQIHMYVL